MIPINRTYAPLQAFCEELARCGVRHAVTSPGSRNAPIALSLAGEPAIEAVSVLDERSAGFVAVGMAKAGGRPVAVTCTSGTAAANLLPAVAEARESRVPLVVLTADRPPELRDVGAGQAIDQLRLYGPRAKLFVEVGNLEPGRDSAVHHRSLACRAVAESSGGRPGPVHLNFPLREPLAPAPEELDPEPWQGRPDSAPWVSVGGGSEAPSGEAVAELARAVAAAPRGALVCGPTREPVAAPAAALARSAGWPLLAEPTSGARCGAHDRSHVIAHYDVLLRDEGFAADHTPELVLRVGDAPTSKPLRAWLERTRQVVIDPHAAWHEPTRLAERMLTASPALTCQAIARELGARPDRSAEGGWVESWKAADALVSPALLELPDPFEPKVYASLADALPDGAVVWVSSSMPIRDVEAFFPAIGTDVRFLANRGANGIDGVVSSALGAALASRARTYLLTGELALLHDLGGLLAARRLGNPLTVVCVNNGGGGIFDFLPLAGEAEPALYEEHVITPAGIDLERVAALVDLPHARAETSDELRAAAGDGPALIEVVTDRAQNVALHRELYRSVAARLPG